MNTGVYDFGAAFDGDGVRPTFYICHHITTNTHHVLKKLNNIYYHIYLITG